MGSGCIDPHILDLGTSWRWVVRFTPRPLYPQGNSSHAHWMEGWVGPRAGQDNKEMRKFLTLTRSEIQPLCRSACSLSLCYPGSRNIMVCHSILIRSLWTWNMWSICKYNFKYHTCTGQQLYYYVNTHIQIKLHENLPTGLKTMCWVRETAYRLHEIVCRS
jgi:hypothetical protein